MNRFLTSTINDARNIGEHTALVWYFCLIKYYLGADLVYPLKTAKNEFQTKKETGKTLRCNVNR